MKMHESLVLTSWRSYEENLKQRVFLLNKIKERINIVYGKDPLGSGKVVYQQNLLELVKIYPQQ
ncbi:hypothetical protein MTR_3g007440 [Medicago truncatula]|uniref:Uncharacterized protein n=1 Tax=Medicago truncatula TaxID=3880 RepID=G7IV93_MEDTR|nr:hypothetical protein MTR_3g007440 [Medicago truncatula]